jgi:hypothetical protein
MDAPRQIEDIRFLVLTKGKFATVSPGAIIKLAGLKYYAHWGAKTKKWTAVRRTSRKTPGGRVFRMMHRDIMDAGDEITVDHRDGDTLNNRGSNLRSTDNQHNAFHRTKLGTNNTTGYRGVCFVRGYASPWRGQLMYKGKTIYAGHYKDKESAATAVRELRVKLGGDFAGLV